MKAEEAFSKRSRKEPITVTTGVSYCYIRKTATLLFLEIDTGRKLRVTMTQEEALRVAEMLKKAGSHR